MDERIIKKLYENFKLSTRQGQGGMTFKYVPNEDVINRMNEVFNGNWSTNVKFRDVSDDQVILEVEVSVVDPETQMTFSHTGFGSQQIMRYNSGPNAGKIIDIGNGYKGALAKAIVNACTRWGVGLFKESNPMAEETPVMVDPPVVPPPTPSVPVPEVPAAPVAPPAVAAPSPIVVEPPPAVGAESAVAVPPTPPVVAPVVAETTTTFPPTPPSADVAVSASLTVEQEAPAAPAAPVVPEMPKVPVPNVEPPAAPAVATPTPELPMTSEDSGLGEIKISDVQKVALNGILTMNNAQYEPLAEEAFAATGINKAIPTREDLTYEEAVVVIKYGNEKYRKNR